MGQIGREIQTAAMAKMFIAWNCMKRKKSSGFCRNGEAQRPAQFPRFSRYSFRVFVQKLIKPKHSYCLFGLRFKNVCGTGNSLYFLSSVFEFSDKNYYSQTKTFDRSFDKYRNKYLTVDF